MKNINLKHLLIVYFLYRKDTACQTLENGINLRLPTSLVPLHYTLRLRPFLGGNFTVFGSTDILFKAIRDTDEIVLHMKDIVTRNETVKVTSVSPTGLLRMKSQAYDVQRQFYIIKLAKKDLLKDRQYILSLDFDGTLSSDLEGFYRTSYVNAEGNTVWVAATQFQPTSARRAFPCFDEPHLKAKFDVYLGRTVNMTALSNMPLQETYPVREEEGWVYDKFETSFPMSTYLVAFVICDFESVSVENELLRTNLKLWSRESLLKEALFAKRVAEEGLVFLESFFNLSFPLPKLDVVAVPEMSPNAMENWGLIITRESGLLYTPERSSVTQMQWVAYLMAHELAHQWFGNIVTMQWWTDLWLSEGFATFLGYSVVDHIFPSWKILDRFVVNTLQKVMKIDALESSPPVRVPVEDPCRIREIFGEIAYNKGASLIRMMQYFLGENAFQGGLSKYLDDLKYKSAEEEDLWYYLTKEAHKRRSLPLDATVRGIMKTWTAKSGYPVVTVEDRQEYKITLSQKVFRWNPSNSLRNDSAEEELWYIPVTWSTQGNPQGSISGPEWISKDERIKIFFSNDFASLDSWILFNPNETGFYRVNYDLRTWKQLTEQLKKDHTAFHPICRAQLIDDALNLARMGSLDYDTAFGVLSYLDRETEYVAWTAVLNNMAYMDSMLRTTIHYGAFKEYLLTVISKLYAKMGVEDREADTVSDEFLRTQVVMWACHLGYSPCIEAAENLTTAWMDNPNHPSVVPGNLAETFFCAVVREGDEFVWHFLWQRYRETNDGGLKKSIARGLGCSRQVWILKRYLEAAFVPELGIRRQDASFVYATVADNEVGSFLAWNYMKEKWLKIKDYLGTSMFALPDLVKATTNSFNTLQFRDEIMWFKRKYEGQLDSAKWTLEQALESTEANVHWIRTNLASIGSWLKQQGFSSTLELT